MSKSFKGLSKTLMEHLTLRRQSAGAVTTKKTSVNLFQAITAMKKGLQVWKLPHRHYLVGKAHMCCLRLSTDEKSLYWYSQKNKSEVVIYLEQIVEVASTLPEEMKSWTGYCESLAFTVYFHAGSGGDAYLATPGGAAALGDVTFVCKNATDYKIWTVTLQILLKFSDLQKGEDRLCATPPAGLPNNVMSKEISQVVRNIQTVIIDEKVESSQGVISTPGNVTTQMQKQNSKDFSLSCSKQDVVSVRSAFFTSGLLPPETSPYCADNPSVSTPLTGSIMSYPAGDRVIGDSWVWGRGMDKVGKQFSDQGKSVLFSLSLSLSGVHIVSSFSFSKKGKKDPKTKILKRTFALFSPPLLPSSCLII